MNLGQTVFSLMEHLPHKEFKSASLVIAATIP
jgi:hypothetical protein